MCLAANVLNIAGVVETAEADVAIAAGSKFE